MKNRLVFRILGALSSGLIIASVFIPFVSVTGYSESLWETNKIINTQYLPIMIIVFGAIGVLAFAINVKTELAYASSGALLFYLITQTIPVINQNLFNTFGVGYYCLAAGTILTGIMAFICNLRVKKKNIEDNVKEENVSEQVSVIDQIDKLYNDQTPTSNNADEELLQPLSTQELPIEPLQPLASIQNIEQPVQNIEPIQNVQPVQNIEQSVQNIESNQTDDSIQNTIETNTEVELQAPRIETQQENAIDNSSNLNVNLSTVNDTSVASNPVTAEFDTPATNNPVTAEFDTPATNNPVIAEFDTPATNNPVISEFNSELPQMSTAQNEVVMPTIELSNNDTTVANNPVTSQFDVPQTMSILPQKEESKTEGEQIKPLSNENTIQPLGSTTPSVDVMADQPTNTSSNLDIFG